MKDRLLQNSNVIINGNIYRIRYKGVYQRNVELHNSIMWTLEVI